MVALLVVHDVLGHRVFCSDRWQGKPLDLSRIPLTNGSI